MGAILRIAIVIRTKLYSLLRRQTLGACVLAVDDDGKILLIRQTYDPTHWRFPGGGLRHGETMKQAALREAREEVGLELTSELSSVELFGVFMKRIGKWHDHAGLFVVTGWTRVPNKSIEIAEVALFDPNDLPANTAPSVRRRIDEWKNGKPPAESW